MRKIKKVTAVCLAMLLLIVSLNFAPALAADDKLVLGEEPDEILVWFAEEFAKKLDGSLNLHTADSVPVYDLSGDIVAYMISYEQEKTPCGYIILDLRKDGLIAEFAIHENTVSMFADLEEAVKDKDNCKVINNKLIQFTPFDYFIEYISQDSEFYYFSHLTQEIDDASFQRIAESYNGCLTGDGYSDLEETVYTALDIGNPEVNYINSYTDNSPSSSLLSQSQMQGATYDPYAVPYPTCKYACAVLALTEIAIMEGIVYQSIGATLNYLWTATNTVYYSMSFDGVGVITIYGGTPFTDQLDGMSALCGVNQNTSVECYCPINNQFPPEVINPSASLFTYAVDHDWYSTFNYWVLLDGQENSIGHAVCVVGYTSASLNGGNTEVFIAVGDGWHNDNVRFMSFNENYFNTYNNINTVGVVMAFRYE